MIFFPFPDNILSSFDKINKNDWYVSRFGKHSRGTILKILFVAKPIITGDMRQSKDNWKICLERCNGVFQVALIYTNIADVIKAMVRRYEKEKSHDGFDRFFETARHLWDISQAT